MEQAAAVSSRIFAETESIGAPLVLPVKIMDYKNVDFFIVAFLRRVQKIIPKIISNNLHFINFRVTIAKNSVNNFSKTRCNMAELKQQGGCL